MASVLKLIAGFFILIIGFPIFIGGSAVLLVVPIFTDNDGYFMTRSMNIQQDGVAAVRMDIPLEDIQVGIRIDPSKFVTIKVNVQDNNSTPVFFGITTSTYASEYLSSISYIRITNFNYFDGWEFGDEDPSFSYTIDWQVIQNITTWANPLTDPVTTPTWIVGGELGDSFIWEPSVSDLEQGTLSLIIIGEVGTTTVDSWVSITFSLGAKVPIINAIGWFLLVFGGLITIFGIIVVWSGLRTTHRRSERVRYYQGAPTRRVEPVQRAPATYQLQCSNCGSLNEADSSFCSQCGEVLLSEDMKTVGAVTEKKALEMVEPSSDRLIIADWWSRFWAFLIDYFIVSTVSSTISSLFVFAFGNWTWYSSGIWNPIPWVFNFGPFSIFFFLYFLLMEYYYGQTLGKMVLNLETVSQTTGQRPTIQEFAISAAGKAFFLPFDCIIGVLAKPKDQIPDLNQRFSQQLAKTVVIRQQKEKDEKVQFISSKF
ncbi:MAG: RDD family protein [Candidatus Heimdallarchaeota archaeon]|nr:RDD family protein [Candidatus Heimdallarchaeota archaeon]